MRKERKKRKKIKERKESYKTLKTKAWKIFSEFIRRRGSSNGMNFCVTCGVMKNWKELQAGHFLDGRHNAVLFNPLIVWPQCLRCNIFLKGNKVKYTLFMQNKFGQNKVEELLSESHRIVKLGKSDLKDIINRYTDDLNKMVPEAD